METGFRTIETRFDEIFANLPNRTVALLLQIHRAAARPARSAARAMHLTLHCARNADGAVGSPRAADRRDSIMATTTTASPNWSARSSW